MPWNEDDLHRWLSRRPRPAALTGSRGHDAAVLNRLPKGRLVTCLDQTIEGVHFESSAGGKACGRKAVLRTLSDLAATAAQPFAVLLGLRAPKDRDASWMRAVLLGAEKAASDFGASVVGGDLAAATGPASLSVTALGEFRGKRSPGRDLAESGQLVLVTGPCGGSLTSGRHLEPRPRLEEGEWLNKIGATAMMDVSDGVAIDLHRIARASKVQVLLERVPLHRDLKRFAAELTATEHWHGLHDGEDHELLVTISPDRWKRVEREASERFPKLQVIGRVQAGRGLRLSGELAAHAELPCAWTMEQGGFVHGG